MGSGTSGKEKQGLIFDVQRLSLVDGPGGRTTVFLKGCPLACAWCCNPESFSEEPEIILRDTKCSALGKCVEICPQEAVSKVDGRRVIDWERCDRCGKCADACPAKAIERIGRYTTVNEVMKIVMEDVRYYRRSGGGITLSGGEPLAQTDFTLALLEEARREGVHTALDTCGYAEWEVLKEVLNYTDLALYDVKHIDSAKHREAIGVPNELILENLQKTAGRSDLKVWIRYPVVPLFNDSDRDVEELCHFVGDLGPAVERIALLPYHNLGVEKYPAVGRGCSLQDTPSATRGRVRELKDLIESRGLKVGVGGGR